MNQSVILSRTALMQSVSDAVRLGYHHYATGSVTADRAASWARKACRYYGVDLDRNRRARAKLAGEGRAFLFLHENAPQELVWALCCTDGDHPAHRLEQLRDARSEPITLSGYELVRMTRPGSAHPAWTWRFARPTYETRRAEVVDTARRGDPMRVRQLVHSLYAVPGFAGLRRQTGKLVALLRREWRRARGRDAELPYLPAKLFYVQRTRVDRVPLSVWLSLVQRQRSHLKGSAGG
jgi:hypothetical protein